MNTENILKLQRQVNYENWYLLDTWMVQQCTIGSSKERLWSGRWKITSIYRHLHYAYNYNWQYAENKSVSPRSLGFPRHHWGL